MRLIRVSLYLCILRILTHNPLFVIKVLGFFKNVFSIHCFVDRDERKVNSSGSRCVAIDEMKVRRSRQLIVYTSPIKISGSIEDEC